MPFPQRLNESLQQKPANRRAFGDKGNDLRGRWLRADRGHATLSVFSAAGAPPFASRSTSALISRSD